MKNYEFKISEDNSNNIFGAFSNDNCYNFYNSTFNNLNNINTINTTKIEQPKNQNIIGDALSGKKNKFYSVNNNISVFNNFNSSADETERQYIAATRELKPVKIDDDMLKEMKKFNLLDD